ncbi:DUF1648 domain-containing protein [Microbacterium sp. A93]|uniref:DUF1648 domain-containing protein n=1 Tax=Microbacterium sp. A93 TaxID=3450716 RepID=UPI003F41F934
MTDDVRRARAAFLWVGVIVPLALFVLAAAVIIAWMPELPEPMAIHWGSEGVDGFASQWGYIAASIGIGAGVIILLAAITAFAHRLPQSSTKPAVAPWSVTARFMGAINLGLGAMIAFIAVAGAALQRGLSDAADTPGIGIWTLVGFGLLVGFTVLGWFLQPKSPRVFAPNGAAAERIPLAAGEKLVWVGTANMSRIGVVVLLAAVAFLAIRAAMLIAEGDAGWWIYGVATVVIALLVSSTLTFRVRVNARGLSARSLLGWPRTQIPLSDIERVETVEIDPFREFGGWGWRLSMDGRRGIVLRTGEALQVTQSSGRVFVVTLDGASEVAAVLETLRTEPTSSMNKERS